MNETERLIATRRAERQLVVVSRTHNPPAIQGMTEMKTKKQRRLFPPAPTHGETREEKCQRILATAEANGARWKRPPRKQKPKEREVERT